MKLHCTKNMSSGTCLTIALLCLFWVQLPTLSQDKKLTEPQPLDPNEWTTEIYQFPGSSLTNYTTDEWSRIISLPNPEASPAELKDFLRENNRVTRAHLESGWFNLPKGSLVIFDRKTDTFVARVPRAVHTSFAYRQETVGQHSFPNISTHQIVFEAPATLVRSIMEQASSTWDHTELLQELKQAVANGSAKTIDEKLIQSRAHEYSSVTTSNTTVAPIEFHLNSSNQVGFVTDETIDNKEFTTSAIHTRELITDHSEIQLAYAPQVRRTATYSQKGGIPISRTVVDRFEAKINSQLTTRNGKPTLLAVWTPELVKKRTDQPEMLQAVFITNHILKTPINHRLKQIVDTYGEQVIPIPEGKPKYTNPNEEIPGGMIVQNHSLPPFFLEDNDDKMTARELLENAGIFFPKGSWASYTEPSTLKVCNTPDQIFLVDCYLSSGHNFRYSFPYLALTTHIVEAPKDVIKNFIPKSTIISDNSQTWNELTKSDEVSILSSNWICCNRENEGSIDVGLKYNHLIATSLKEPGDSKSGGTIEDLFDTKKIGTKLFIRPRFVRENDQSIDLEFSLDYHYAPPTTSNRLPEISNGSINLDAPMTTFHHANVETTVKLKIGTMRMVSMWKPKGTPELDKFNIRQAVFIKVTVIKPKAVDTASGGY